MVEWCILTSMQLFIHKYTCNTCQALLNACQALIDQSIGHFGINYTSVRHYGIRHFGIRHSGNHPCITVSRRGTCYVQVCCKSSRKWARFQTPHRTRGYGWFSRWPFFASLATALLCSSILPWTSQGSGWILVLCLAFMSVSSSFFLTLIIVLLPLWHCNNEIASAATALGMINLRKYTQLFLFIALLNGTDVCVQATPFNCIPKQDRSWGHTLPTDNTLCKISSLVLRHSTNT